MSKKILVTPRSLTQDGHPSLAALSEAGYEVVRCSPGKQPSEAELLALLAGCEGYLAGVEPITARVLESARELKAISRNGVGVDNIDLEAARRLGIEIFRAEGANAEGVAELAVALMFSLARSIPFCDRSVKTGGFQRRLGIELDGKTLGLVGCGRIGRIVARLALGLGMQVLAYDVFADHSFQPSDRFRFVALDEVLRGSDVISLHAPAQPGNRPLLDTVALAKTRRGVLLVNTARASLVDGAALRAALESGQVAGVATDVFDVEPPANDDPLVPCDRVIATSHIGSYTRESLDRLAHAAVDNLIDYLQHIGEKG